MRLENLKQERLMRSVCVCLRVFCRRQQVESGTYFMICRIDKDSNRLVIAHMGNHIKRNELC